jgi:hypothetical protein
MERDQALAGDDLEPVLLAAADIAVTNADEQRAVRRRVMRLGWLVRRNARGRRDELGFVRFINLEERKRWLLWHGNALDAIEDIESLADDVDGDLEENPTAVSLRKPASAPR